MCIGTWVRREIKLWMSTTCLMVVLLNDWTIVSSCNLWRSKWDEKRDRETGWGWNNEEERDQVTSVTSFLPNWVWIRFLLCSVLSFRSQVTMNGSLFISGSREQSRPSIEFTEWKLGKERKWMEESERIGLKDIHSHNCTATNASRTLPACDPIPSHSTLCSPWINYFFFTSPSPSSDFLTFERSTIRECWVRILVINTHNSRSTNYATTIVTMLFIHEKSLRGRRKKKRNEMWEQEEEEAWREKRKVREGTWIDEPFCVGSFMLSFFHFYSSYLLRAAKKLSSAKTLIHLDFFIPDWIKSTITGCEVSLHSS